MFEYQSIRLGSSGPYARSFQLTFQLLLRRGEVLSSHGYGKVAAIEIDSGEIFVTNRHLGQVWPPRRFFVGPAEISSSDSASVSIPLEWNPCLLEALDRSRAGNADGSLPFEAHGSIWYRNVGAIRVSSNRDTESTAQPWRVTSRPLIQGIDLRWQLSRDEWHSLLKQAGWDEFQVFEVPVRIMKAIEPLAKGIERLREAQNHFANGQWDAVVTRYGTRS